MNLKEVEKHTFFQIFFIIFVFVTMAFTIYWLLTENVSAASGGYTTINITNSIQNTSTCGNIASGYYCYTNLQATGNQWYRRSVSLEAGSPIAFEFSYKPNTTDARFAPTTIALFSAGDFKNVSYNCSIDVDVGSAPSCSAVYSSSNRININFTPESSDLQRFSINLNANGSVISRSDELTFTEIRYIYSQSSQPTNADIINNNTQNTQDIIQNNNNNTQDVIANQTENTQNILDKMTDLTYPSCDDGKRNFLIGSDKTYISNASGNIANNNNYWISQPVRITGGKSYELNIVNATNIQGGYYCFYDKLNTRISCTKYNNNTQTSYTFTAPSNAVYFRASLYRDNDVFLNAYLKGRTCVPEVYESNLTEFRDFLNSDELKNFVTDDSNPNISDEALSNTLDLVSVDDPLGYLATLPLTLLAKINTNLETNSCTPFNLGKFGFSDYNLTLPCIQPENYLGNTIWSFLDLIISVGLLSISVYKLHHTVNNFLGMGSENEVNSYSAYWSPMEFLMIILGGEKGYSAAYDRHFGGDD